MNWAAVIVGIVALERLGELFLARSHTRTLLGDGGYEIGGGHYPLIVALHTLWLITIYITADKSATPVWGWVAVFVVLQALRYWVIATLGKYWTTRIIVVPGAPLVRRGPYRLLQHPNYVVVIAEIAVLPLAFREYAIAIVFSLLNAMLLWWRVRIENGTLSARR